MAFDKEGADLKIELLEMARRQGMRVTQSDFRNMLELVASGEIAEMREIFKDPSNTGPIIKRE